MPNNAANQVIPQRPGLLITRPAQSAETFAQMVRARVEGDVDIIVSPILAISHASSAPDLEPYRTLIFTSAHAVTALAQATPRRDFVCYTVGSATLTYATSKGFEAKNGGGTAERLAQRIMNDAPLTPCLYLRGKHVAHDLAAELNAAGIETHEAVVYAQDEVPLTLDARHLLSSGRPVLLPMFSVRSAELFIERYTAEGPLHVIAMSENVANAVPKKWAETVHIARQPNAEAMVAEVVLSLRATNQLEGRVPPK